MTDLTFSRSAQIALPSGITRIRLTGLLARIAHAIRVRRDRAATRRDLHMLSDRELADVGLRRTEIETVVAAIR